MWLPNRQHRYRTRPARQSTTVGKPRPAQAAESLGNARFWETRGSIGALARVRSALLVADLFAEFLTLVSFFVLCRPNFPWRLEKSVRCRAQHEDARHFWLPQERMCVFWPRTDNSPLPPRRSSDRVRSLSTRNRDSCACGMPQLLEGNLIARCRGQRSHSSIVSMVVTAASCPWYVM